MAKAIIFDVDGTLAETEEVHREAFNAAFAASGLDWHWSEETYFGLLKTTGGKERIAAWHRTLHDAEMDRGLIAALHAEKTRQFAARLAAGGIAARSGIHRLIGDARGRGMRLAIATTTTRANVDALCPAIFGCPAEDLFEVIAAGDEVPAKKPAPDVYLAALSRLGLSAVDCIAIEDSRNGVAAARAAGIAVLASRCRYTRDDDLSGATLEVADFDAIAGVDELERTLTCHA